MKRAILFFAASFLIAFPAAAQDAAPDMGSLDRRVELATKMHELRPAREQVDNAVEAVARRMPEDKRDAFRADMKKALDYKAVEKASIDAMAETFSEKELEAMVEYYSKPEARSISEKYSLYQARVSPQIVKMLDKAMMDAKTGGAKAPASPAQTP